MAIRSSSQLGVGRDDDRWSPGFTKNDTNTPLIFGGMVLTNDIGADTTGTGKIIKLFGATNSTPAAANPLPLGLAYENTNPFTPPSGGADNQAGAGFDIRDFARGGLYSAFHRPGNLVDVFDDFRDTTVVTRNNLDGTAGPDQGRSAPFLTNDVFVVGDKIYSTNEGLLTRQAPTAGNDRALIGLVRAISGTAGNQIISLELRIQFETV